MFKQWSAILRSNFLRIPKSTVAAAFLIPFYFTLSRGLTAQIGSSAWESLFCDPYILNLWVPIADLVLLAGIGVAREDDATRFIRMKSRGRIVAGNLLTAATATLFFTFACLGVSLLYSVTRGMTLTNAWSPVVLASDTPEPIISGQFPSPAVFHAFSPVGAMMMQMLYLNFYCFFLSVISMTVNALFKQSVGSIVAVFAMMAIAFFGKQETGPYTLLPSYNGNFKTLTEINQFTFSYYALAYWLVLITAAALAYAWLMRKTDLIGLAREDRT